MPCAWTGSCCCKPLHLPLGEDSRAGAQPLHQLPVPQHYNIVRLFLMVRLLGFTTTTTPVALIGSFTARLRSFAARAASCAAFVPPLLDRRLFD